MEVVISSGYRRDVGPEAFSLPVPDVPLLFVGVNFIVKIGIRYVDFFGIDSDNGTVFLVQLANLENICATMIAVVEEFVPIS